jgi:hypothetical protein
MFNSDADAAEKSGRTETSKADFLLPTVQSCQVPGGHLTVYSGAREELAELHENHHLQREHARTSLAQAGSPQLEDRRRHICLLRHGRPETASQIAKRNACTINLVRVNRSCATHVQIAKRNACVVQFFS